MGGSFETSPAHGNAGLQPLQVAVQRPSLMQAAVELAEDLGWSVASRDDDVGTITCTAEGGFLRGSSTITITFEGPEGIPSTTVNLRSETRGGVLSPDKGHVGKFRKLFDRRTSASK